MRSTVSRMLQRVQARLMVVVLSSIVLVLAFLGLFNQLTIAFFVALAFLVTSFTLAFRFIVVKPLRQISDMLISQDLAMAKVAAKRRDEFGQIGSLVVEAFNLARQIEKEKVGVEMTVSERTRELLRTRIRLEASINSLASGLLITFREDKVALGNPALLNLFGLSANNPRPISSEQLLGAVQSKLGKDFDLVRHIDESLVSNQPFSQDELVLQNRYISIQGTPIHAPNEEKPIGCVVMINDITEAKQLENSKDEFLSIASHELRTPLTVIRGNAALLQDIFTSENIQNEQGKYMLDDIRDSAVRLIDIVNQFLATSRLEQHKTKLNIQPVDLGISITNTVAKLQPLAAGKKLQLTAHIPDNLPLIDADPLRLEEVVTNLISNAIKYTNHGSISISVKPELFHLKTSIRDTGRGIDPKDQGRLFGKFQQATPNILSRDTGNSTGLGLYITKLLIEQMGGLIQLEESTPGKGSVFSFTLPLSAGPRYDADNMSNRND